MKRSFLALAVNFVGYQLLWAAAVYGAARGWPEAAWAVLVPMVFFSSLFSRRWHDDLRMLLAGAVACLIFEPLWLAPSYIHYVNWSHHWVAPGWIWALWLGFAVSFNYCLGWLRQRLWLAALFGAVGGVISVTVGARIGAASMPHGWWALALSYGFGWLVAVPILAGLSRFLETVRADREAPQPPFPVARDAGPEAGTAAAGRAVTTAAQRRGNRHYA